MTAPLFPRRPGGPPRQRPASPSGCRVARRAPGPHTPGEIAKDLGRSSGAVGNALTTLADRGEAGREPGNRVRYKPTVAPPAAAAAITPRAPLPPKAAPAPAPAPSAAPKP